MPYIGNDPVPLIFGLLNSVSETTSATSTTIVDADQLVLNDVSAASGSRMKQIVVTDLAAYLDDEITAMPNLVSVGALNVGSITSGFTSIDVGAGAITTTGIITGGTLEATADTSAGDNAAIGYTSVLGLILTGQGSTNDVTIVNDADATVMGVATGTTSVTFAGNVTVGGDLDVTGSFDMSDADITNIGSISLDSITGDADANTSITFSGSDVITIATGGTTALTVDANQDLNLLTDAAVIKLGANGDVTLTHVHNTGVLLNAASVIQFRDSGLTIGSNADGDLDIVSDGTAVDSINIESAGGITLDAGTASSGIIYEDDGTEMLRIHNSSSDVIIESKVSDKDIIIKGNDGGSARTVATFDMSAGGDLFLTGGLIDLKNNGSNVSQIKFYCESSNAHAQTLIGAPHNQSANNTLTLPDGSNGVLLSTVSTATVTNKTLTSPVINTGTFGTSILPVSADGTALGSTSKEFSDLFLADSSTIQFGNDQDTILTHTDGAGLTLNSTNKLMFNDASQFIQGASATVLDIAATDEIELTATLIDVVGNATVSGTLGVTGIATFTDDIIIGDGKTIGSASDVDAITIASDGDVTFSQKVGIIGAHDLGTGLHIRTADSGASVSANADELIIEGSGNTGITIASGNDSSGNIFFADDGGVQQGKIQYDHDSNAMQFRTNNTDAMKIDAAGHVTQPSQPAVQVKVASAISNIAAGALYNVPFATEIFDNNADFQASTGDGQGGDGSNLAATFTAPVTGRYVVMINGTLGGYPLAADYVQWHLATSNRTYNSTIDPDGFDSSPVYHNLNLSALVDMDANDTALAKLHIQGSVDTTDIFSETYFSIYLAC